MVEDSEKSPVADAENLAYELVNKVARGTEVLLARLESVGSIFEQKETPTYNVTVNSEALTPAEVKRITDEVRARYERKRAVVAEQTGTPLSREQLLREVYRFNAKHSSEYLDWAQMYEDDYAVANGYKIESLLTDLENVLKAGIG